MHYQKVIKNNYNIKKFKILLEIIKFKKLNLVMNQNKRIKFKIRIKKIKMKIIFSLKK